MIKDVLSLVNDNQNKSHSVPVGRMPQHAASTSAYLVKDLEDKLEYLKSASSYMESNWCAFRDIRYSTSMEHIGPSLRRHQGWFDQNNTYPDSSR